MICQTFYGCSATPIGWNISLKWERKGPSLCLSMCIGNSMTHKFHRRIEFYQKFTLKRSKWQWIFFFTPSSLTLNTRAFVTCPESLLQNLFAQFQHNRCGLIKQTMFRLSKDILDWMLLFTSHNLQSSFLTHTEEWDRVIFFEKISCFGYSNILNIWNLRGSCFQPII